jgi:hypothetical protein
MLLTGVFIRRGDEDADRLKGRSCDDAHRKQPSASQGERAQRNQAHPHLGLGLVASSGTVRTNTYN